MVLDAKFDFKTHLSNVCNKINKTIVMNIAATRPISSPKCKINKIFSGKTPYELWSLTRHCFRNGFDHPCSSDIVFFKSKNVDGSHVMKCKYSMEGS